MAGTNGSCGGDASDGDVPVKPRGKGGALGLTRFAATRRNSRWLRTAKGRTYTVRIARRSSVERRVLTVDDGGDVLGHKGTSGRHQKKRKKQESTID